MIDLDYEVVPMRREHVDALMPFERELFGTEAWTRSGYLAELADVTHRDYRAAVGANGSLLGWAGVRVVGDEAEVLTVGVVPDARRRGVARRLMSALSAVAMDRGASDLYLEVRVDNEAALALYRSEGFEQVGLRRGYYDAGRVDAVVMHREL